MAITVLEYSTERICVDFEDVKEGHYPRMLQVLVDVVFSKSMLDVVRLLVVLPVLVKLVNLASNISLLLGVESLENQIL